MEISSEDALRLNVLLAGDMQAIRINESEMTVYGLSHRGEAKVRLNPTCRDDQYLRLIRETISAHVLGSPGGYPVYLKRWTRMGQARDGSLEQLLKLGEPEAVSAVVHAPGLTDELASRAWWAMPTAENARSMLQRERILEREIGVVLARYLVEHLPFEEEPSDIVETVRLVLQPGLIGESERLNIWNKGWKKNTYLVGFLLAIPDALPDQVAPHPDAALWRVRLQPLVEEGNPYAVQLMRVFSRAGQTFLAVVERVLRKPVDQDVVLLLFDAIAAYFETVRQVVDPEAEMEAVIAEAERFCAGHSGSDTDGVRPLRDLLEEVPELLREACAMLILARVGYPIVRPIFSRTTAVGTLMRKKLEPVTNRIFEQLAILQGRAVSFGD